MEIEVWKSINSFNLRDQNKYIHTYIHFHISTMGQMQNSFTGIGPITCIQHILTYYVKSRKNKFHGCVSVKSSI